MIVRYADKNGKECGAESERREKDRTAEGLPKTGRKLLPVLEGLLIIGLSAAATSACAYQLAKDNMQIERDAESEDASGDTSMDIENEDAEHENDADAESELPDVPVDVVLDAETEEDAPAEVEGEPDASVDPDVTMDPDVTTDPDVEIIPDVAPEDFGAEDVTADGPADVVSEDGPCSVYSETQMAVTITLGDSVVVGNVSVLYAEAVSGAMDRFELSYNCDGTVVDNNFRVGEFSGTNREYPSYTFRVSIRNRGSTGGTVTADITVTDY